MKKTKIAVIGLGFVGGTIYKSFENYNKLLLGQIDVIGIDPAKGLDVPYRSIKDSEAVFVCVPSPMNKDGSADTTILEQVLEDLSHVSYQGVIISKVTAPPNIYQKLQAKHHNLVHAPEFLTAANAYEDYINGTFAIIGGESKAHVNEADRIIQITQRELRHVMHCSITEASLAKYAINSFLATKVVFMNEMAALTEAAGGDWNIVNQLMALDPRIGKSHMQVPGPDGQFGFGGMCFPKDTRALLHYSESVSAKMEVLDSAVKKNMIIRLTQPK